MFDLDLTPDRLLALALIVLAFLFGPSLLKRAGVNSSMRAGDAIPFAILGLLLLFVIVILSQHQPH